MAVQRAGGVLEQLTSEQGGLSGFPGGPARTRSGQAVGQWVERLVDATEERMVAAALPAPAGRAARTRLPRGVHPLRRLHYRRARCRRSCARPTDRGLAAGTPYLNIQVQAVHRLSRHALRPRLSHGGAHGAGRTAGRATGSGTVEFVPERCVTYKGVECQVCAKACPVGERALAIDEDGHPGAQAGGMRRLRQLREGVHHVARRSSSGPRQGDLQDVRT